MKLSAKIKELRKLKGLTQFDLSDLSGISLRTIQRIENDETKPSKHSLNKIGEALDHDFDLKKSNRWKNILKKINRNNVILFFALITISIGGYFYYLKQQDYSVKIVAIKIESDKIEDFTQIEWDSIKEVVSLNADKEILVKLFYSNKDSNLSGIKNFDLEFKLTASNFEKDVTAIEHTLRRLNVVKSE